MNVSDSRESGAWASTRDPLNVTDIDQVSLSDAGSKNSPLTWDDATWILTSSFIIFTMQSGFGLLEAGCVSSKNEVNIMVKNAVDVIFGGFTYWLFGYGLSYGDGPGTNGFVGVGKFCVDSQNMEDMGIVFSNFIFQLSFATTATTIVSGAMAERTKLSAYIVFSLLNTVIYSVPAHWLWAESGFLRQLGVVDIAGSGGVHVVGGVSGLVATIMLKPRLGRYDRRDLFQPPMGNPTNAIIGMFMLWWGWLGFNCGSTFGISQGKWKLAAKSAVTTLNASMGGGMVGVLLSYAIHRRKFDVGDMINGILGGLVGVTGGCAVVRPWESLIIGAVGGLVAMLVPLVLNKLKVDDPVGALSVHGAAGIWGLLAVGLFIEEEPVENLHNNQIGVLKGGGFRGLGVQALAALCLVAWTALTSFIILMFVNITIGLRVSEYEEMVGSDYVEHGIGTDMLTPHTFSQYAATTRRRSSFGLRRPVDQPSPRMRQSTDFRLGVDNADDTQGSVLSRMTSMETISETVFKNEVLAK